MTDKTETTTPRFDTLATIIAKGQALVALGMSPPEAARAVLKTPIAVLLCADFLYAPAAYEPGSEWYRVRVPQCCDTGMAAAAITALAALTFALDEFGQTVSQKQLEGKS